MHMERDMGGLLRLVRVGCYALDEHDRSSFVAGHPRDPRPATEFVLSLRKLHAADIGKSWATLQARLIDVA